MAGKNRRLRGDASGCAFCGPLSRFFVFLNGCDQENSLAFIGLRMLSRYIHVDIDRRSLEEVFSSWRSEMPNLGVMALLPEAEKANLPLLQSLCRELAVPLVGAIFPALIDGGAFCTHGVLLIGFKSMPPHFLLADINGDPGNAHVPICDAALAACRESRLESAPTLFLIFDAMVPNIGSILGAIYRVLNDRVRYAGVNAGSETFQPMPCLFDSERLVNGGVLGLILEDAEVAVEHGYPVAKTLMRAVSTTGNRILQINNRPAMEVYQEVIYSEFGITLTQENFYDYAVHFPFGVVLAADVVVRIPVGFGDDGSVICVGEVPPNSMLRLIRAPSLEASLCVCSIVERLDARHKANNSCSLLTFYCAGRRMHFGDAAADELLELQRGSRVSRLFGALSLGEIGMLEEIDMPEFHNAAIVCL